MTFLLLGLVLFLGAHSVRLVAPGWREACIARLGANAWKGLYALVSAAGLALVIWGYGRARLEPSLLWAAPVWTRHLAALLTLAAFVLVAAAYAPRNHVRRAAGHPMLAGTAVWAFAHLLANGTLADLFLFGGFLAWAGAAFAVLRGRDRAAGVRPAAGTFAGDAAVAVGGAAAWALFAFVLHGPLIGVRPFG